MIFRINKTKYKKANLTVEVDIPKDCKDINFIVECKARILGEKVGLARIIDVIDIPVNIVDNQLTPTDKE